MPKILVGCPIYNREWALPKWLDALASQKSMQVDLAFCLSKGNDRTEEIIRSAGEDHRFGKVHMAFYQGSVKEGDDRDWSQEDRVALVAEKRNLLLDYAGGEEFDAFLMLDSDVFVAPDGLLRLFENLKYDRFDAVCPKVWVWEALFVAARWDRRNPGYLHFLPRREVGLQPVDVVSSSACLMTPKLAKDRAVRYGVAIRGADFNWAPGSEVNGWNASECISWSKSATKMGYKLACNCNMKFEHKMTVN